MAGRVGVVAPAGPTRGPAVVALLYVVELAPQSRYAPGVSQTPESLGTGIGPLLADFIPLMPSGARRAGAAQVMAARVGRDPSVLVDNPRVTQLLAMGLGAVGGAYTADQSKPVRAAAMLGPLAIVQLLRHLELNSIQKSYDTEKRKRLRELDDKALLDNPGWFGGSNRLGAVNAYETMRDRKYKGYSSIAEAGDAFHLAASGLHPLLGVSMSGIVSALDNEEAEARRRMHKKADFAEQRNSPVIPLTIAAALLGSLGRSASQNWAVREVSNTPPLGVDKWPGTIASISGTEPLMLASDADGTANAFFYKPNTEKEGLQFMGQFSGLRDVTPRTPTTKGEYGRAMEKLQRLMRSGVMVANERAGAPVIGHEAGHAKIEETPGMLRFLQRHIYPHQGWVAPMAAAGSMAAGLASGSTLKGGLYGTGIGLLSSLGTVGPEAGASYHALKHLKSLGDGSLSAEGKKDLLSALSTYLAGGVLPSVLSGMAGGWISGRRRKKEDEEGVEKQANTAARVASRIAKIFRPAQFTHTGVAPGKNLSGVQPKMWEAWRQHAHLQQMREGLATSKPNFSFNVPHPNTGAMVPHDVHLADSILHTSPNYKPHDRLLTHARIRNTATGQTWEQPMYRSSGATVGHGGTAPAAGHWLPTSGVHGADPSYLAKAQRANAATRAHYPNTPEVNYDTYAKTLSDPRVAAQRVMPGTEPGWIGKQQFDPASGQWVTHDKTDKTLLPIYQHLRDAMGEYAGQLKTASLLIEEGVEKSAAYVPVENAFEKAAAAWQEMRKSGTVGMVEPVRRPRVATGKIPMNWDAAPRPTAPGKAPGAEINLMESKSTVNPADFKTPYYGDQFPAQLEQAAQYNSKNKLPNTTDGWQRPVTVVTSNPTSNSQYAPFVRQGIHGNAVFMPADVGKFLRSQAPEMVAAGAKPADVVAHEVNHAAGENWAAGEHDDAYFVGSTKDPGYAGRQNFMNRLPHDLIPGEHRGYMSTIQAQMFKDTGSRITSPEAYDKWLESMNVHHTDPAVFENSIKSVPVDAQRMLRGMRDPAADPAYLKSLKQWQRRVMPGIVQQAAPMQEKYAALDLRKAWQVLRRIRTEGLTGDMADGLASSLDSKARTLQKHFFSHPDVMRMGIKSRMPPQKIQDMLEGLTAPPTVPAPPPAAPIQGMLDLFKQGQAHPALPALRAAKEHSDAGDYSMKHKLIRQNMRRHADDWSIDSDDGKGIVGVTHIPTGFRLHMPKGIVDPAVLRYHNATQPKPMSKQASTSEHPWASGLAGAGMLGLGGALGRSGLADLNNRNVLLTYGAAAPMGGGHKEPAAQIRQILEELKAQNRDNFLGRMNVIDAPVTSYEGKISNEAAKAMKGKRFLTGVDTGWGLLDPERAHDITPSRASWMDRLRGENVRQQDPHFRQRFENFLQFQPDGRNDATGYMATGDARRISGLRDTHAATYGDFDPGPSHALSGGKLHYMGRAHPLVETKNLSPVMDRDAYSKFLAQHMTQHGGFQGITPDTFRGKKIITVSGATRGDTVGARARWVAEALKAKGHNLDDYVIVGVGGQGPNLARETAIAHAGGPQKNIFIVPGTTAKTGGPSGFNSLIGNSDLHVMGMGGSGPFEALAHGGAPIALIDDEQVFRARQNVPWSESDLIADRGIHGFENKLRATINRGLPADQHLAESAARNWMNPSVFQDAKGESVVRRGLDGIRDYLNLRGVKTLQSGDYDGFANLLKELPQLQGGRAQQAALTLQDIQGGRGMFKSLLEGQLRAGRSAALRHGAGKLALGAGALTGGAALLSKLFGGNQTAQAPVDLRLRKAASSNTRDNVAIGAGGGAAVLGAGIYDTGRSFASIRPLARDYVNATRRYAQKYPDHLWTADAPRIREYLGIVDKYADAAKAMSNLRIMGVPAHVLTSRFPLTSLADDWKTTLKVGLGMGDIVDQKKRWAIMDNQTHYAEGAKTPRALLSREMLSHAADPQLRLTPEVSRVMGADEALRIARAPEDVSMLQRFEPYLKRLEEGKVQGSTFDKLAPFFYRERRMMRGVNADDAPFMAGKGLRKFLQANSVRGYGSLLSAVSTKLSPKLKTVGALLGLAGLGTAGAGVYSKLNKD